MYFDFLKSAEAQDAYAYSLYKSSLVDPKCRRSSLARGRQSLTTLGKVQDDLQDQTPDRFSTGSENEYPQETKHER